MAESSIFVSCIFFRRQKHSLRFVHTCQVTVCTSLWPNLVMHIPEYDITMLLCYIPQLNFECNHLFYYSVICFNLQPSLTDGTLIYNPVHFGESTDKSRVNYLRLQVYDALTLGCCLVKKY